MRYVFISFYFSLTVLLPFATTQAELTGEVIFGHPEHSDELWITRVEDTRTAHRIFREPVEAIETLSVQKGGSFLVYISSRGIVGDIHLLDRTQPRRKTRNLTENLFDGILDVAISKNGDVVFTTGFLEPPEDRGIYLIPHHRLQRNHPAVTLLKHVSASNVQWSPDGKMIAYSTISDVFLLDPSTRKQLRIARGATVPAFSPDGQKIAVAHHFRRDLPERRISILSLATRQRVAHIKVKDIPEDAIGWWGLSWSPDGKYLIYTTFTQNFQSFPNTAVPISGGSGERVFEKLPGGGVQAFDWTDTAYTVEPMNRITTLWGALKVDDLK